VAIGCNLRRSSGFFYTDRCFNFHCEVHHRIANIITELMKLFDVIYRNNLWRKDGVPASVAMTLYLVNDCGRFPSNPAVFSSSLRS
jgi:hypothetical protein